jgi:protein TonB
LTVRRDGSIGEAPRVIRSSGFDDLDAAALRAVERSLPFAPIPADLAPGRPALVVTLPIEFSNPMVR